MPPFLARPPRFCPALLRGGLILCLAAPGGTAASQERAQTTAMKAAFLYHFTNLTRWPDTEAIQVAVIGDSRVGEQVLATFPRSAGGLPVKVTRVSAEADDLASYQVVFIPESQEGRIPRILKQLQGARTLTVSDARGFARDGGMIEFVHEGEKLRFDINQRAAQQRGLRISAKLLELAREVLR